IINLIIWDVAGHTLKLHPAFTSEADGAILVCDLSRPGSFDSLVQWHNILIQKVGKIPVVVAATKWDIAETQECDILNSAGYKIIKTSAKTGKNVEKVFLEIISKLK
ncbi:MAG: GTP-binding protein, partial [Thermoplasmata archaeon]|nr:GTP-binding protein [Thermoplasmata archaeon]